MVNLFFILVAAALVFSVFGIGYVAFEWVRFIAGTVIDEWKNRCN